MVLVAILVVVALIVVNALYVAAEFAAVSVRRSRIQQLAADGNPLAAWLLPVLESPEALDRYIGASQIGITLSSLVLGAYAQQTFAVWLTPYFAQLGGLQQIGAQSTSTAVVLLTLTTAQVVFAELVPKLVALQYPTQASLYTFVPMLASLWIYRPFIKFLNGSALLILRLMGTPYQAHRHIHSPDEIELLIAESRDGGLLEPDEHRRLQRALRLNLRQAKQLMVSRRKIAALDIKTPLHEVIGIVAQSPFSRLPVYRDSLDNVVGILHTKELVRWFVSERSTMTLSDLIRVVPTVHESVTADRVLRELRERRSHQALVVDEFGGTAGLLTLEDVLSELLGHVGDEFKAAHPAAEDLRDGRVRLPGGMAVQDAATALDTEWETDAATVGGMVIQALGHLPTLGERISIGDYDFEVERLADRVVESVILVRLPTPRDEDEA
ncbi:MAG TPA: hemolysin family protein [Vicinamibacterales bacterium]|jgi:putative hemolysin|nr:hemolysin family protein [Vicinamibacterales bacterium]